MNRFWQYNLKSVKESVEPVLSSEVLTENHVNATQKLKLVNLLNKYRQCIAKNIFEVGLTKEIKKKIEVQGGTAIRGKPYRINAQDRSDLENLIDKYKEVGIVTETTSEFVSPAFIVKKSDGVHEWLSITEN